ncbi:hypothetical protein [Streptomyces sp. NPDC020983]|uniref:hypothetical protein n=1 Tax=Streptomyces sp. NPDC020983 TaxID=3365106 RepID=UPI0037A98826
MKRRLLGLLLALCAVFGVASVAAQPAAADGVVGTVVEGACDVGTGPVLGVVSGGLAKVTGIGGLSTSNMCHSLGSVTEKGIKKAWKGVWNSVLGDLITSAEDATKWAIKETLTVSLLGPSVDLAGTGLWGKNATLAGMLVWLGLVIAAAGIMWNLGRMAVTGQSKHLWRSLGGWVENLLISAVGVSLFAFLLAMGDALSSGLVDKTFSDDNSAYERIIAVLLPETLTNPVTVLCIVGVLLLIGFVQMVMIFLRQSAIPIICLLLPVAGGGRTGGDATRKWAPTLITTGMVIIAYKPIVAIIICTGFSEFGHASNLVEWLRGCATLLLAVLAPGPLTKIFAPFGSAVGGGLSSGGASGALSAASGYFAGKVGGDGDSSGGGGDGGGDSPSSAVEHARYVEQSMGSQGGGDGNGGAGGDAQAQAARNDAAQVPAQAGADGAAGAAGAGAAGGEALAGAGAAGGGAAAGGAAAAAAGPVGIGIAVLDGVNDAVQGASGAIGGGGQQ